jgi:hypothetical protein
LEDNLLDEVNVRACWMAAHLCEVWPRVIEAVALLFCIRGSSLDNDDRALEDCVEKEGSSVRTGLREEGQRASRRGRVDAMTGEGQTKDTGGEMELTEEEGRESLQA